MFKFINHLFLVHEESFASEVRGGFAGGSIGKTGSPVRCPSFGGQPLLLLFLGKQEK